MDEAGRRIYKKLMAQIIRKDFGIKDKRKPCAICGRYKSITEKHHLVSVKEIVTQWVDMKIDHSELLRLTLPIVWLCPNHHTLFHAMDTMDEVRLTEIGEDCGVDEFLAVRDFLIIRNMKRRELKAFLEGAKKDDHFNRDC